MYYFTYFTNSKMINSQWDRGNSLGVSCFSAKRFREAWIYMQISTYA